MAHLLPTLLLAVQASLPTDGTTTIQWLRPFTSPLDDWINHIVVASDGTILVAGFVNRDGGGGDWRSLIASLTPDGEVIWSREHGSGGGVDAYWSVVEAANGNLAATGLTTRMGHGGIDAHIAVLTPDGYIVKENPFGGPDYDRTTDIALAGSGYAIAGFTTTPRGDRDVLLVSVDSAGVERWRRTYSHNANDQALYLEPTADGGFVLAGTAGPENDADVLVLRVDSTGTELWRRVIGEAGGNDIPHNLNIHPDGRIQMTGYTRSWGARVHDMLAITLSESGAVLSHEIFGGPDDDRVMLSALDGQGRNWMTGYTRSVGAGGWDVFIARLDAQGRFEEYVTTMGGPGNDNGTAILPLDDGTLLIAAYTEHLGIGRQDAVIMRVTEPAWREAAPGFIRRVIR